MHRLPVIGGIMPAKKIKINRAPVLTLWAAVVAERLGHSHRTALTLGKAVAGLNAQAKGQRLGIFEKPKEKPLTIRRKGEKPEEQFVSLLGRKMLTVQVSGEPRAVVKDAVIDPDSVAKYLSQKFSDDLADAEAAMRDLAKAYRPEKLAADAYSLYERFRPNVPGGEKGWGARGKLDLGFVRSLAR
jgi:hypothetical protein